MLDRFTLHRPSSLEEASELLTRFGDEAAVYAGGTELLVVMKERLAHFPHLIDIKHIPGLREIAVDAAARTLTIGALATHREIERSPIVREWLPELADLAATVANARVRAVGTLGGNLCFAEPHSDPATLLTALDAVLALQNATSTRNVPITGFFSGVLETVRHHDELLTHVTIPLPAEGTGVAYERFKLHERPTAAAAAVISVRNGAISDARVVAGSVGDRPQRLPATEAALLGAPASDLTPLSAARVIRAEVKTTADAFESEAYKRQLASTVGERAIAAAIARARSGERQRHAA